MYLYNLFLNKLAISYQIHVLTQTIPKISYFVYMKKCLLFQTVQIFFYFHLWSLVRPLWSAIKHLTYWTESNDKRNCKPESYT